MDLGLTKLERALEHVDVVAPGVSRWSVGMHLHHCLLATTGVCHALIDSQPPMPRTSLSPARIFVMTTGRIPRGRGKSPDSVMPREGITRAELQALLADSHRLVEEARQAPTDRWFRHFAFGTYDRDGTLKFIRIHNLHHGRIIDDILSA